MAYPQHRMNKVHNHQRPTP